MGQVAQEISGIRGGEVEDHSTEIPETFITRE